MKAQSYLAGAKILVVSDKLVPEVKHLSARLLLEDWCYWQTVHTDPPSQTFLELLHVEMAFVKLGLTSLEHPEDIVAPEKFTADFGRKLLKGIQSGRRQIALSPAWVALQNKFSRPPEEPPTKRRRAGDKCDDEDIELAYAEVQPEGQVAVQPNVGDGVLTHSLQKKSLMMLSELWCRSCWQSHAGSSSSLDHAKGSPSTSPTKMCLWSNQRLCQQCLQKARPLLLRGFRTPCHR